MVSDRRGHPTSGAITLFAGRVRAVRRQGLVLFGVAFLGAAFGASGSELYERALDAGARHELAQASGIERNLILRRTGEFGSPGRTPADVDQEGAEHEADLPPVLRGILTERRAVVDSVRHLVMDAPIAPTYLTLRAELDAEGAVRLTSGRDPSGTVGSAEMPRRLTPDGRPVEIPVFEVAISDETAERTGIELGDRYFLAPDRRDPLVRAYASGSAGYIGVDVVGIFEMTEPEAEYWLGDTSLHRAIIELVSPDLRIRYATALLSPDALEPFVAGGGLPVTYSWRYLLDHQRVDAATARTLHRDLRALESSLPSFVSPTDTRTVSIRSGLSRTLGRYESKRATTDALLSVAGAGAGGVAAVGTVLIAAMLTRRRESALRILSARGASRLQLAASHGLEALAFGALGALAGLGLAALLAGGRLTVLGVAVAVIACAAIAIAFTGMAVVVAGRGDSGAARRTGTASARRLVVEAAVAGGALLGVFLLLRRGIAGSGAPGDGDLYLSAVPLLVGVAAALVTLRLYPPPVAGLGWLAARSKGLLAALAMRRAARETSVSRLSVLAIVPAAAVAAFGITFASTIDRSQDDEAWQRVGADHRITAVDDPLPAVPEIAALPGVDAVAAAHVRETGIPRQPGTAQRSEALLYAVDVAPYEEVLKESPMAAAVPDELHAAPEPGAPIPALVSTGLRQGDEPLQRDQTFELIVGRETVSFVVAARAATFPGLGEGEFVVAPLEAIAAAVTADAVPPTTLLLASDGQQEPALPAQLERVAPSAAIESRPLLLEELRTAPLVAAVRNGFAISGGVAGVYAVVAVVAAMLTTNRSRARETAHLRAIGLAPRDIAATFAAEQLPPVFVGAVIGVVTGVVLAFVVQAAIELEMIVGTDAAVDTVVEPAPLALLAGAFTLVVMLALFVTARIARRADPATALRQVEN